MLDTLRTVRPFLIRNRTGLTLILLTWAVFFSRTLTGQAVYFLDDLKIIYYPLEYAYAQFQQQGELPQWSPLFGFGQPLLAWGQLGFFTPLHLILRAVGLPALTLLQASILTYFLAGAVGMYALLRRHQLSSAAAGLGGVLYAFSGFHVGHLNHINFFTVTMLLPWLLVSLHRLSRTPGPAGAVLTAVLGAAMALSGQPQVVTYSFLLAALYLVTTSLPRLRRPNIHLLRLTAALTVAALLALMLASFAILPLLEFLPLTERAADQPTDVLLEFSYPPYNTITLIFPYFFGDHEAYWGPKGLQELAAFTGILPLVLSGAALTSWRRQRTLRLLAVILLVTAALGATGRYSPLYRTLVERHVITALNVPGRFAMYFTAGIALLTALALDDLRADAGQRRKMLAGLAFVALVLLPFGIAAVQDGDLQHGLRELTHRAAWHLILIGTGLVVATLPALISRSVSALWQITAAATVALTLVTYAWQFNPLTPTRTAFTPSPFTEALRSGTSTPPRLYARDQILQTEPPARRTQTRRTDQIAPRFSLFFPITAEKDNFACLALPAYLPEHSRGTVQLTISTSLTASPLRTVKLDTATLVTADQHICFSPLKDSRGQTYFIGLTSETTTGLQLISQPTEQPDRQAFFVRVQKPRASDIQAARKPLAILAWPEYTPTVDLDAALLNRHLNATAGTSSARWIGALSIKNYRDFIEDFFANDIDEPFTGDGQHAIVANRKILNLAGISHLTQSLVNGSLDAMASVNFPSLARLNIGNREVALYTNPDAFPKAFLAPEAIFNPAADDSRRLMTEADFDPARLVLLNGPKPPSLLPAASPNSFRGEAIITNYQPTAVTVRTRASHDAVLVVTDSTTPQWHTYLDGTLAPYYVADTVFKAALVPAGEHTVTFRYQSPATARAIILTRTGLLAAAALLTISASRRLRQRLQTTPAAQHL